MKPRSQSIGEDALVFCGGPRHRGWQIEGLADHLQHRLQRLGVQITLAVSAHDQIVPPVEFLEKLFYEARLADAGR